jgi:uncharacterized repeat protein (TIGR03803 family)
MALLWGAETHGDGLSLQTLHALASNPKNAQGGLVQAPDGHFYGTTQFGGTNGENGTVFRITPTGTLSILHAFDGSDGALPSGGLVQATDGGLYGVTQGGGTNGDYGVIFRITTNGTFKLLHSFCGSDGRQPVADLVQGRDGAFYGTTAGGGPNGDSGTVFKITSTGVFTSLFSFPSDGTAGRGPRAGLSQDRDGNFYGTTALGGSSGDHGTVFRLSPSGSLTPLFFFDGTNGSGPEAGLARGPDGNLYGTTQFGGNNDHGTVFRITPSGALTTLHSFSGPDGSYPMARLVLGNDNQFYGTTSGDKAFGGTNTFGTIFRLTAEGTLTTLACFLGTDGASPVAALVQGKDGRFYGTTFEGGAGGGGTIFRVSELPTASLFPTLDRVLPLRRTSWGKGTGMVGPIVPVGVTSIDASTKWLVECMRHRSEKTIQF